MCFEFQKISKNIFENCEISYLLSRANFINIKLIFKILFSIKNFIIFVNINLHSINIKKNLNQIKMISNYKPD